MNMICLTLIIVIALNMPKQFLQTWLPSQEKVANLKLMRFLGQHSLSPKLWYVNRRSISYAVFVGTFFGVLPVPCHSLFIIAAALILEINLPISLVLMWLSNPLTLIPILYGGFWLGTKVFHVQMINQAMLLGVLHQICHWFFNFGHGHIDLSLAKILLTGLLLEALILACIAFVLTRIIWRWSVIRSWKKRAR